MFNGFQLFDYESVVLRLFDLLICLSFTLSFSRYLFFSLLILCDLL